MRTRPRSSTEDHLREVAWMKRTHTFQECRPWPRLCLAKTTPPCSSLIPVAVFPSLRNSTPTPLRVTSNTTGVRGWSDNEPSFIAEVGSPEKVAAVRRGWDPATNGCCSITGVGGENDIADCVVALKLIPVRLVVAWPLGSDWRREACGSLGRYVQCISCTSKSPRRSTKAQPWFRKAQVICKSSSMARRTRGHLWKLGPSSTWHTGQRAARPIRIWAWTHCWQKGCSRLH